MADPSLKAAFAAAPLHRRPRHLRHDFRRVADGMGFTASTSPASGPWRSHLGVADAGIATYTDMVGRVGTLPRGCTTPVSPMPIPAMAGC